MQVIQQPLPNNTYLQQLYNAQGPLLMPGNIALHPGINSQQIQVYNCNKKAFVSIHKFRFYTTLMKNCNQQQLHWKLCCTGDRSWEAVPRQPARSAHADRARQASAPGANWYGSHNFIFHVFNQSDRSMVTYIQISHVDRRT